MPLAEEGLQSIRDRVAVVSDWANDDWNILGTLLTEDQPNPVPQRQVLREMFMDEICEKLANANLLDVVRNYPTQWRNLCIAVVMGDHETAKDIVQTAYQAGIITQAQRDGIRDYADELVDDPNWPALVSWAQARFGRGLSREDVKAARL